MITKQRYIESGLKEFRMIQNLFANTKPGVLDYRPTSNSSLPILYITQSVIFESFSDSKYIF